MYGEKQIEFLKNKDYLIGDETIEERIESIANVIRNYENKYSDGLADRIKDLITRQILSPSTPQWANVGRKGRKNTSDLPCSCNIITVEDSIAGFSYAEGEVAMLSKLGAGVGIDYSNVREKGTALEEGMESNSVLDWMEDGVRKSQKVSQGANRRGYAVPFISITNSEYNDLLARVHKSNPNKSDPLVSNNIGILLPKGFRQALRGGNKDYQKRFLDLMKARESGGHVYVVDEENLNINQSPVYRILDHTVKSTNICTEVVTPHYDDKTFACIIASLNLVHWNEIRLNPQIIKDAYMFLDIMVEEYIRLTGGVPFLEKARRSAIEKRDIGLGTLGFHEYLQMNNSAYGDLNSRRINREIYSTIRRIGEEVTADLGERLGSPKMCQEAKLIRRNVSLMMVAPNKSTAFICGGTSKGILPFTSNFYMETLAGIQDIFKNPYLSKILDEKNKNTSETWESILANLGSVQHLDFLTKDEKDIFRTFSEISPKDIIDLASDRQEFIDMAQSINLIKRPNYTIKDLYDIHMYAFDRGIKTLYYMYSQAHSTLEKNGEAWNECISCAD